MCLVLCRAMDITDDMVILTNPQPSYCWLFVLFKDRLSAIRNKSSNTFLVYVIQFCILSGVRVTFLMLLLIYQVPFLRFIYTVWPILSAHPVSQDCVKKDIT